MSATMIEARDIMLQILTDAWIDYGNDVSLISYPDKPFSKPNDSISWCRPFIQHVTGGQATLGDFQGKRRFTREGFITIQVFAPSGNGLQESYQIGNILVRAYETAKPPLGLWFKNIRSNEAGKDGNWQQTNVVAEFSYDEIN